MQCLSGPASLLVSSASRVQPATPSSRIRQLTVATPAGMPRQHAAPANVVAGAAGCRVLLLLTVNWKSCLNRLHVATPRNQDREFPIALVWRRVGLVDSDGRQAG